MDLENLMKRIENGEFDQKGLINIYNNANNHKSITEEGREKVISAVEKATRVQFPKAAKKIFGAKDHDAREILSKIFSRLSADFDFSKNKLRNGVKTGGDMISGEYFVQVYLSYKNQNNYATYLVLQQDTVDSELRAKIAHYKTGGDDAYTSEVVEFGIDDEEEIYSLYHDYLKKIVTS